MKPCKACGRYRHRERDGFGVYVDDSGYLRISAGPLRGKRVHVIVAEAKIGRKLERDEQVHHIDGDKLNCDSANLTVMGIREHGAVSRKQAFYFKQHDINAKKQWDDVFKEDVSFETDQL
jgi:hypothetical protein